MQSGALDSLVTIQQATETQDAAGEPIAAWSTVVQVWAKIEAIQGREFFDAQVVQADLTHRVTIRYRSGIVPKMRIVYGSRTFEITAVHDDTGRRAWLTIMAVEKSV